MLRQALNPAVTSAAAAAAAAPEIGWEEEAEAAATHLLRGPLARSAKEAVVAVAPLAGAGDTARLRKHLGLVFERLGRGARLSGGGGGGGVGAAVVGAQE